MRTPPLLLGATLAFWGWNTGFLVPGLLMGAALEASRLPRRRWDFTTAEFNQLWNITVILFLGAVAFAFASKDGTSTLTGFFGANNFTQRSRAMDQAAQTVLAFLQWLPLIFFPFVLVHAYSNQEQLDFKTFSWFLRRKKALAAVTAAAGKGLHPGYPYFGICIYSASTASSEQYYFLIGLCPLVAWALWPKRSPRFSLPVWGTMLLLAGGLGFGGTLVLRELWRLSQALQTQWLNMAGMRGRDAREARTAIGQVGRLKGSGRIILRVEIPEDAQMTSLLRETAYTMYRGTSWQWASGKREFGSVYYETNETTWILGNAPASNSVRISAYLDGGRGVLAVPHGVTRLDELAVFDLKTNNVGTLRVDSGPGLVLYRARSASKSIVDAPPDTFYDLDVPTNELPAIQQIVGEAKLANLPEAQRPRALESFFARQFSYTLYQDEAPSRYTNDIIRTPLAHFLLKKRAGHCEFFATATTLLLREAGIPARYVVGYSVQESAGKNKYVVRGRHAHAWCVYYDRAAQTWRELDTTPGTWLAAEEKQASFLEPFGDAFSWLFFQFSKLRWGQGEARQYVFYVLAAALVLMIVRFITVKRWKSAKKHGAAAQAERLLPGLDSEFYLVEKKLIQMGLARRASEPLRAWLERIQKHRPADEPLLHALVAMHYRLRFDPAGLPPEERASLREQAMQWLKQAA